ncbi:MAG: aspartyl protease family protein, partial [Candidatus Azotimanducaceae bacterium]
QRTLYLSTHIDSSFATAEKSRVMINMTDNRQYITAGTINGRPVTYLVDTGANVIALNSVMAKSLDIALYDGVKTNVSTAGGTETATRVLLKRVSVGGISRSNVAAVVIDGAYPRQILLGMSFLQHVDINENGRLMILTSKL